MQFNVAEDAGTDHIASISADMYAGFRTGPNHFVINDKADGTGADVMVLSEIGGITLRSPSTVADLTTPVLSFNDKAGTQKAYINWNAPNNRMEVGAAVGNALFCAVNGGVGLTAFSGSATVSASTSIYLNAVSSVLLHSGFWIFTPTVFNNTAFGNAARLKFEYTGAGTQYGYQSVTGAATGTAYSMVSNASTIVGSITVTASATAYNTTSDARMKSGVKAASDARVLVDALEVIEFVPVEPIAPTPQAVTVEGIEPAPPKFMGIPAQQAYTVYPYAVKTPDIDMEGYSPDKQPGDEGFQPWMIDYSRFVPMLMANTQDNNSRLDALEARLAALEAA